MNRIRALYDKEETRMIHQILNQGIKNGEFRSYTRKERMIVSYIIVGAMRGLHFDMFTEKMFIEVGRINFLIDVVLRGIMK